MKIDGRIGILGIILMAIGFYIGGIGYILVLIGFIMFIIGAGMDNCD